ncbi:esterase [Candidatus Mycolicibacterium alkanivorans]|uniref:RsiV family protein n=1 Tax=Candidatus Mycolicibacterium alkanivorans TaxID=2954114 RepID=A0ABS9Z0C1_9MYCO|nr:esterase [Candidatus Mycolicibacterium alkanivorans]MCI4676627.1 RsiV family protein [Candidatus Mycolicibacterium alkanivorans]
MRTFSLAALLAAGALIGGPTIVVASAQNDCAALGGALESGNVCHVSVTKPAYTMDLRFPTDYPDEQAIVDYLTQNRDGFVNVAQPDSRNLPYEMDATSQTLSSAQTQSAVLKIFQDVGGAHPMTWYKAFTYDLAQRKPVTFDTLFAPGVQPLEAIFPIVQRELRRQTGFTGAISTGDGMDPSHYQNFAITDDAVIFYFGQGELLPSDAGATSAAVPRTAIPPLQL